MSQCHCGSEKKFEDCCSPYLNGAEPAPTAEALMRSRYSAFVVQNVDYLFETHHADTRHELSLPDIESWAKNSEWLSLEVRSVEAGSVDDTEGKVEFVATYLIEGKRHDHHEMGEFKRVDGIWFFHDGKMVSQNSIRTGPKVGRNDPCPCGSGKKYKKCCAM